MDAAHLESYYHTSKGLDMWDFKFWDIHHAREIAALIRCHCVLTSMSTIGGMDDEFMLNTLEETHEVSF